VLDRQPSGDWHEEWLQLRATAGSGTPAVTYSSTAEPVAAGQTGQRDFCTDQSGVIYSGDTSNTCTVGTNPL